MERKYNKVKRAKHIKLLVCVVAIVVLTTAIAAAVNNGVRNWLYEAFNYVFWSAIGLGILVMTILYLVNGKVEEVDRSRDTVDWEMEQDRLREQEEEEEWLKSNR